jgi:hypothetical protein
MLNKRKSILTAAALASLGAAVLATPVRSADRPQDSKMDARPAAPAADLYSLCALYPKPGTCEDVYRQALQDDAISAQAVKAEYEGYVRYLGGNGPLTEEDRQYLSRHGIRVAGELTPANQAGLHNVINDPALSAEARLLAVNNFVGRAIQAELYCSFNHCGDEVKNVDMVAR